MPKVLPSQLTDEEILALLESDEVEAETQEIFDYTNDIVPFLSFYKITPGETPVAKKLFYKLYKAYSKEPVSEKSFAYQMGNYISGTSYNYHVNIDTFAISNHIYKAEKTRDKTKSLTYQKHFQWFLTERGVEKGTVWIEGFILFFIYKDFCKARRVTPRLGYVNFHKFLKLHLPYRRIKENRALWFHVNKETATIFSEEEKNVIRKAREKKGWSEKESQREAEKAPSE